MAQEAIAKFWMVWNPTRRPPSFRHMTKTAARDEAKRLSSQTPGELFIVLAAVDAFLSPIGPVANVPLRKATADEILDSEIPF